MSMFGAYWQYRRTKVRMKRPELAFLELFLFSRDTQGAERQSPIASMRKLYQLGQYHSQQANEFLMNMARKMMPDPDSMIDKSQRLSDSEWSKIEAAADDGGNRSESARNPDRDADRGNVSRMHETGTDMGRIGMRIRFRPDNPENRVASDRVGPDRQIPLNTDPWPLGRPDARRTPEMIEGPKTDTPKAEDDNDKAPTKEIKGPVKSTALESPEASEKRRATVTDISDAPSKRSGKAASDRGAEKARQIAQDRAAKKKIKGPREDQNEM